MILKVFCRSAELGRAVSYACHAGCFEGATNHLLRRAPRRTHHSPREPVPEGAGTRRDRQRAQRAKMPHHALVCWQPPSSLGEGSVGSDVVGSGAASQPLDGSPSESLNPSMQATVTHWPSRHSVMALGVAHGVVQSPQWSFEFIRSTQLPSHRVQSPQLCPVSASSKMQPSPCSAQFLSCNTPSEQ